MFHSKLMCMQCKDTSNICVVMDCHACLQVIERLHTLADEAAATLAPIARPMWWLDPADEATFTIHDQFALGQDMIVAPVVEQGAVTRNVYLTAGLWRDAFDKVQHSYLLNLARLGSACLPSFLTQYKQQAGCTLRLQTSLVPWPWRCATIWLLLM